MTSVSFGPSRPSSSRTEWIDRKRHATDDLIDSPPPRKRMYHVILESESELPTDESDESVYSVQDKETDFAKDTSDTSTHSDNSYSRLDDFVEFEVVSESEVEANPLGEVGELSSGAEDIFHKPRGKSPLCCLYVEDDFDLWADSSDSSSRGSFDVEIPKADYWTCLQCKSKNNNPLFRYCEKCFQIRKSFFPERPKRRRRPRRKIHSFKKSRKEDIRRGTKHKLSDSSDNETKETETSPNSAKRICTEENNINNKSKEPETPENTLKNSEISTSENNPSSNTQDTGSLSQDSAGFSQDSAICLSNEESPQAELLSIPVSSQSASSTPNLPQPTTSNSEPGHSDLGMCIMCMIRPKNGIYIHSNGTSHLCSCYECAHRVWLTTKKCPICNGKIGNISKVFVY